MHARYWTHPSVKALAGDRNPLGAILDRARQVVFSAVQEGWSGPPFDPFALAELLRIPVVPRDDVLDARVTSSGKTKCVIEFNPNRPTGRVRYSVAHELAHTLFPDCLEHVRERQAKQNMQSDDWQLEMLCNIGASEFLMPIGSFPDLRDKELEIDELMRLRKQYDVSAEALLLRAVHLTNEPCLAFCASRKTVTDSRGRYRIDYSVTSRSGCKTLPPGTLLPHGSCIEECTAIGYTAKGNENWPHGVGEVHLECVGIPSYPGCSYPRVVGVANLLARQQPTISTIRYLRGDATEPRGEGNRILAFVVNDKALSWGAGFGRAVQRKWPLLQEDFKAWAQRQRSEFVLGNVHSFRIDEGLLAIEMICQKGYGPSPNPRIRYEALESCLRKVANEAAERRASVHMPRIGSGEAGGRWPIVCELIEQVLCEEGIDVTVYDLPDGQRGRQRESKELFDLNE